MKVAFLSFAFAEYSIELASALAKRIEVGLFLPHPKAVPDLGALHPAVQFQSFERPRLRQPWQQVRLIRTLARQIQAFDPDVLHLQQGHLWFNLALPLFRHYPLVITIHDPRYHLGDKDSQKTPQWLTDYGFRQADQLIVHTEQVKQTAIEKCGLPEAKLHVIPHIAPPLQPMMFEEEEQYGQPQILFFGRIWEYKGLDYLIRAEPLITSRVPNAQIVIAGTGEDFGRYRKLMVHPERFLVYNDYIPQEQVASFFQQASVVVLPYVEATQSGVVAKAYGFGKPVVATTVGGLPEQIEHGRTGLLVPPRDERALADAIVSILQDCELRRRLGTGGYQKTQSAFSTDLIAQKTVEVYQRAQYRASNA
jgi:starch synthase